MIKYKLACNDCKINFDSWFASSNEYEKLKKKNFLECYKCNSRNIDKTLMAPQFINSKKKSKDSLDLKKYNSIKKTIINYQKFIKNNFNYVGKNFAHEARSIHYSEKKKNKGIYGIASNNEIKELKEEGINTEIMPWFKDNNN